MMEEGSTPDKDIIFKINDWAICRVRENDEDSVNGGGHIFADHIKGCSKSYTIGVNNWCYEWMDNPRHCWLCEIPVPEEVIGLVLLSNFDNVGSKKGD